MDKKDSIVESELKVDKKNSIVESELKLIRTTVYCSLNLS